MSFASSWIQTASPSVMPLAQTILDASSSFRPARSDDVSNVRQGSLDSGGGSRQQAHRDGCARGAVQRGWRRVYWLSADCEALVAARGGSLLRRLPANGHRAGGGPVLRHRGLLWCARRHPRVHQGRDRPGIQAASPPVPPGPVQGRRARLGGRDQRVRPEEVPAHCDSLRDVKGWSKCVSKTEIQILIPAVRYVCL